MGREALARQAPVTEPDISGDELPDPESLERGGGLIFTGALLTDYVLRTGLASLIAGAVIPQAVSPGARAEARRMAFYAELARARDAEAVFRPPSPDIEIVARPGRGPGVEGGRVELLRFASPYEPLHPELRPDWSRHENNLIARAQHWRHDSGPRRTLCVIHGFGASPAWLNTAFFGLKQFFAEGWDILLYTMPFHGGRRASRTVVNGLDLFAHGFGHFNEAIIQAVHDFRAFFDYLERTGSSRIGVTGISLGGFTSALLAAAEPRLDFVIPNVPVIWLPELIDGWCPANAVTWATRTVHRVSREDYEQSLAVVSPLTYAPVVPKDRLMVIGGLGDRLAPPEQSLLLWEHWGRPRLHWFPGSHVIHFGQNEYIEAMHEVMGSTRD
jgi:hypothetical protein